MHPKPLRNGSAPRPNDAATVFVTVLPVGWIGDWHENPKPQWIIPLSGRWFVESMDGQRVEMGPGEISFGEDKNTRKVAGKQGHLSGTLGDEPAVLHDRAVRRASRRLRRPVGSGEPWTGFEIRNPRFARYILGNAALETLASGFRWIEGPVWMGDANCLLFQDLPNDRTMRWSEGTGVSVYRSPVELRERADQRPPGTADRLLASRTMHVSNRI